MRGRGLENRHEGTKTPSNKGISCPFHHLGHFVPWRLSDLLPRPDFVAGLDRLIRAAEDTRAGTTTASAHGNRWPAGQGAAGSHPSAPPRREEAQVGDARVEEDLIVLKVQLHAPPLQRGRADDGRL